MDLAWLWGAHVNWINVLQKEMHVENSWEWPFFEQSLQMYLPGFYMIYFWINQLESHTNNVSPHEMQKVRRTRRENVTKREANISILASQEKFWIFRNSPQKEEGEWNRFLQSKELFLLIWYHEFVLWFPEEW